MIQQKYYNHSLYKISLIREHLDHFHYISLKYINKIILYNILPEITNQAINKTSIFAPFFEPVLLLPENPLSLSPPTIFII